MERYLFRGKRVDCGDWLVGNLLQRGDWTLIIPEAEYNNINDYQRVCPTTVGQCTGLRDKNGKMIFEGDILKYEHSDGARIGAVTWASKATLAWMLEYGWGRLLMQADKEYEITGNVHDGEGNQL